MKIRTQVSVVLDLDKCIGCRTCPATCKSVWTSCGGAEYAWFNNIGTKPGIGFPKNWEDQEKWNGGWVRKPNGKLVPKQGGRLKILSSIFASPNLPQIDDYYEPFTYDYEHLQDASRVKTPPTARSISVFTGKKTNRVEWGPDWEDDLASKFGRHTEDTLFKGTQKEMAGASEQTFMIHLPHLCEHCLNPTCVAFYPPNSIYKREDDGIVLIGQDKCRGQRMCASGCPYKEIYYNWVSSKAEKCISCYPRIEAGEPTVCSETCIGHICYLGMLLYDVGKIEEAASVENPQDLCEAQLGASLDLHDPEIQREALKQGIGQSWLGAARKSPVCRMAMEWKVAFPPYPEYHTPPVVWYIPPFSLTQSVTENGLMGKNSIIPSADEIRIPLRYPTSLPTVDKIEPIREALERMTAVCRFKRGQVVHGETLEQSLDDTSLTPEMVGDIYQIMAIINYEDRLVIPAGHKEVVENGFKDKVSCGFSFGDGCSDGSGDLTQENLFGKCRASPVTFFDHRKDIEKNKEEEVR